jgi:hypothetical protein
MKAILLMVLMHISIVSLGATIIIKGQPSPLEYNGVIYYLPQTYEIKPETTYLYITMDGINKVCFLNTSPSVTFERIPYINIFSNGRKTIWNCFPYKTTIHAVRP